jgi:hypothetical protein
MTMTPLASPLASPPVCTWMEAPYSIDVCLHWQEQYSTSRQEEFDEYGYEISYQGFSRKKKKKKLYEAFKLYNNSIHSQS